MATSTELEERAVRLGRSKKRKNAIVALLSGGAPAVVLAFYFPFYWHRWLLGLCLGLLWGNAFEYAYHRWLLHRPRSAFGKGHLEHHVKVGSPDEAEHVSLGKSPVHIFYLFAVNGILVIVVDLLFNLRIAAGIFVGWSLYLITAEEIHWRIHLGGWLPRGLQFARAYHMAHHDIPNAKYNVFLPLFDLLCGTNARPHPRSDTVPRLSEGDRNNRETLMLRFLRTLVKISSNMYQVASESSSPRAINHEDRSQDGGTA